MAAENSTVHQDYEDALSLIQNPAWQRYFERKLRERRQSYLEELAQLDSNDVAEFKKLQAKIAEIDEILKIPGVDVKNVRNRP